MNNKVVTSLIGAAALTGAATAGEVVAPEASSSVSHTCDALKSLGKLYKNSSNPFIQEVKLFGRAQWQYAYLSDETTDKNGSETKGHAEWRRVRAGGQVKFAQFFDAKVRANLEEGGSNNHQFGFDGWDESKLGFNAGKAFGIDSFDKVYLTFGRDKIEIGEDVHTSSKKIKTVERSALTGAIRPGNSTGVALNLAKGDWKGAIGVFNGESDKDGKGDSTRKLDNGFGDSQFFYATSTFGLSGGDLILDLIVNPDSDEADQKKDNKWATSVAYRTEVADWDLALNAVLADDEKYGLLYGAVIQPSKYIIEDKLEFVGRYYFQSSEDEGGASPNSRYSRDGAGDNGLGKGDFHQSVYAGLNYYFCDHNAKIMTGVEYETISGNPSGKEDSMTTLWGAVRFYF